MTFIPIPTDRPVRVRIAPSPTGDPHVGTAYIGLFNTAFARKHGGSFVLRVEDTDQARSTPQSEAAIMSSLRWAGLTWDEGPDVGGEYGPYRQSERSEHYRKAADQLIAAGHAYPCFATPEELAEARASLKATKSARGYDRRYRSMDPAEAARRVAAGDKHVVRLAMPIDGETNFVDGLRGEISFTNDQIDDQILLKSDGLPTYHLANVVDDHMMEITHVIRAEEWISSTPKHVQLYKAFGWEPPTFIHMPLLRNPDGSKISKRKNPTSLDYYQRIGILPEALLNYLARMGWSMPDEAEKFTVEQMIEAFDFARMTLGGPKFDLEKLDWLNGLYIRELGDAGLVKRLQQWAFNEDYLSQLAPLARERIERLDQFIPLVSFLFGNDFQLEAEQLIPKKKDKLGSYRALKATIAAIDATRTWDVESIEAVLRGQSDELEWKLRDLSKMVRMAVTGRKGGPGLWETMEVLGKARSQARLRAALKVLKP